MILKDYFKFIISIAICQLAGAVGSFFTVGSIDNWYAFINKPEFTPPGFLFGPVWIILYFLMGVALFLVWRKGFEKVTFWVFAVHLVLNALWSVIFFGMKDIGLALIEIIILWLFIVWSMVLFRRVSHLAFYLLIPYILWASFAVYLNYSIWILN